jgi:hypothetical protein
MCTKNRKVNRNPYCKGIWLVAGLFAGQYVHAGSVLMSPPPTPTLSQTAQEDYVNNEMNVFIPSGVVNPDSAGLFEYGPVTLHPHVSYGVTYGDGLESGAGSTSHTVIQTLSPGLTADLGRHWTVGYTPTFNFYSSRTLRDSFDQSASLNGATHYGDWGFNLSQNFSDTSDPLTETAAQTDQQSYGTALSAVYAFNDKMSASFGLNQNLNFVSQLQNSYNWSTIEGLNYEFWPRLNAGISLGGGYTAVDTKDDATSDSGNGNPDSVNEQLNFNVNWRATDKISFQVSAGLEDQQFLAAGYDSSLNPIFSGSVQYQPFKFTEISLTASRTVGSSDYFISAQSSENTSVSLSLNQRILVKYNLGLSVSYTKTDFTSTYTGTYGGQTFSFGTARSDDDYTFNASFGRNFLKHGNWAVTYQYSDNESSLAGFSQRSNQIGLQVSFNY